MQQHLETEPGSQLLRGGEVTCWRHISCFAFLLYHCLMNNPVQLSEAALGTLHHNIPRSLFSRTSALARARSQLLSGHLALYLRKTVPHLSAKTQGQPGLQVLGLLLTNSCHELSSSLVTLCKL